MALPRKLRSVLPLLAVLVLVLAVCLHFCLWKSGMFIDEIYTYGLANSHYMPFIGHGDHDRIQEQIITREDFFDYLAVTDSEPGFDVGSVYYNQVQDVHPPLYYWILNFCSTLARGQFSKWIGLIPDLLIYLGLLALLYALGMELFGNRLIAASVAALYGFSQVGLSTMLMIRMYVLMTLFTVLLALLVARELRAPSGRKELGIGLTIFAGLMTQYYFVFYAFFLCALAVPVLLCRRDWKPAVRFSLSAFVGVGMMLLCFPAVFTQMTGHRLGPESDALANLKNVSAWAGRLRYYFGQFRVGIPVAILFAAVGFLIWLVLTLVRKDPRLTKADWRSLVLLLPVIPTVFVPAIISPVLEGRYIYNVMPIAVLAAGFCLLACSRHMDMRSAFGVILALSFFWSLRSVPDYIYDEQPGYTAAVTEHAEAPCLYLTEYYAGVTQDMLQLMVFDEVFVTDDPASQALESYLKQKDCEELVVYIDIDSMWGSGFVPDVVLDELEETIGYAKSEHLYQYALSDTYLLRR